MTSPASRKPGANAPAPPERAERTELQRHNAVVHGLRTRGVLPWEDADESESLLADLRAEWQPIGATERALVDQLAGLFWRARRIGPAEAAAIRAELARQSRDEPRLLTDAHVHAAAESLHSGRSAIGRVLDAARERENRPPGDPLEEAATYIAGAAVDPARLLLFTRYEAAIGRQLHRVLSILAGLQDRRRRQGVRLGRGRVE